VCMRANGELPDAEGEDCRSEQKNAKQSQPETSPVPQSFRRLNACGDWVSIEFRVRCQRDRPVQLEEVPSRGERG
jgi:hypothetical protein